MFCSSWMCPCRHLQQPIQLWLDGPGCSHPWVLPPGDPGHSRLPTPCSSSVYTGKWTLTWPPNCGRCFAEAGVHLLGSWGWKKAFVESAGAAPGTQSMPAAASALSGVGHQYLRSPESPTPTALNTEPAFVATIPDPVGGTWPGLNPSRWLWYAAQLESPLLWAPQYKWLFLIHGEHRGSFARSCTAKCRSSDYKLRFSELEGGTLAEYWDHPGRGTGDWGQGLMWRQTSLFSKLPEESNVKTGFEDNFSDLKWDCLLQNFLGDVLTIPNPDSTPSPANQNRRVESKDLDLASRESFSGNFLTHTRNFEHWCWSYAFQLFPFREISLCFSHFSLPLSYLFWFSV